MDWPSSVPSLRRRRFEAGTLPWQPGASEAAAKWLLGRSKGDLLADCDTIRKLKRGTQTTHVSSQPSFVALYSCSETPMLTTRMLIGRPSASRSSANALTDAKFAWSKIFTSASTNPVSFLIAVEQCPSTEGLRTNTVTRGKERTFSNLLAPRDAPASQNQPRRLHTSKVLGGIQAHP